MIPIVSIKSLFGSPIGILSLCRFPTGRLSRLSINPFSEHDLQILGRPQDKLVGLVGITTIPTTPKDPYRDRNNRASRVLRLFEGFLQETVIKSGLS